MSNVKLLINVVNSSDAEMTVHIEPWGVQNILSSGEAYEFCIEGPNEEKLEVEYGNKSITLYGWPDSTVSARTERQLD